MSTLLYLHGFGSSPQSRKAILLRQWITVHRPDIELIIPMLPHSPVEVAKTLEHIMACYSAKKFGVIGASMGGFYATWLSQRFAVPAVLINPLVSPADFLRPFVGKDHMTLEEEQITLTQKHIDAFRAMQLPILTFPRLLWLFVQKEDEILPFEKAVEYYAECRQTIENKGNHSFVGFERHVAEIIRFLEI